MKKSAGASAWAELRADVDVARGRLEILRKNALRLQEDIPKKMTSLRKSADRLLEDLDMVLAAEPFTSPENLEKP